MKEFIKRTLTAIVLIVIVYSIFTYLPLIAISAILYLVCTMAAYEFMSLTSGNRRIFILAAFNGLLIASNFTFNKPGIYETIVIILVLNALFFLIYINNSDKLKLFTREITLSIFTLFYIYFPLYFIYRIVVLGGEDGVGAVYFFFLVMVIAVGDTGAYFIGRALGKTKIYPVASPNKTLEGLIAAIVTGGLTGWLAISLFNLNTAVIEVIITGALMGLISQISDPVESLFKRSAGKKDSGRILPGHGGILDRIDSYILCAPVFYYLVIYFWK